DQRDVGRILVHAVAVGIAQAGLAVEDPGVRQPVAAVVVGRDAGLVVAEERVLPAQRGLDRVADLARGAARDFLVGIDAGDELVARPGLRAAVRADFAGLGVGVADVAVPAVRQRLVQAEGHRQGFALVGIA